MCRPLAADGTCHDTFDWLCVQGGDAEVAPNGAGMMAGDDTSNSWRATDGDTHPASSSSTPAYSKDTLVVLLVVMVVGVLLICICAVCACWWLLQRRVRAQRIGDKKGRTAERRTAKHTRLPGKDDAMTTAGHEEDDDDDDDDEILGDEEAAVTDRDIHDPIAAPTIANRLPASAAMPHPTDIAVPLAVPIMAAPETNNNDSLESEEDLLKRVRALLSDLPVEQERKAVSEFD